MDFIPVFNKNWPVYFKNKLILSNKDSAVSIVTLWTPRETIEKLSDTKSYCLMGNLYTKKGINFIIRNLLAYPKIKKIYITGNDLMESGKALINLFKNGIDNDHKIIGDDNAYIEKEIPFDAIESVRNNIEIIDISGAENIKNVKNIKAEKSKDFWRKPELFPDPPISEISDYPAEIDITKIRKPTVADAYLNVLKTVMKFGVQSEPVINYHSESSKTMKEMLNLSVVVTDEDPYKFNIPEFMPFNKRDIDNYIKGFLDPEKHTEDYTYGERLFNYAEDEIKELKKIYPWLGIERFKDYFKYTGYDQVEISIIRKLGKFKYDKGAIALLANPFEDIFPQRPPKKTPCLFLIQCQIYNNKLNLTAYFRSNDMYNAWPLNAYALRRLQGDIAKRLKCSVGNLVTISNMAHIYEYNFTDANDLYQNHFMPSCDFDPRGNFQIEVKNKKIIIRLMTPRGNETIKEWSYDGMKYKISEEIIFDLIEKESVVSVLGNAGDLGIQLARAEMAVKLGLEYVQDNPLNLDKVVI